MRSVRFTLQLTCDTEPLPCRQVNRFCPCDGLISVAGSGAEPSEFHRVVDREDFPRDRGEPFIHVKESDSRLHVGVNAWMRRSEHTGTAASAITWRSGMKDPDHGTTKDTTLTK